MIALLQEKRQAVISFTVTKGIDLYVPMKDSGIEWLGKMPKHWEVKRLKYVSKIIQTGSTPKGGSEGDSWNDRGIDWFTPGDFIEDIWLKDASKKIDVAISEEQKIRIFPENSIFVVGIGATLGKVGIIKNAASANQQINAIVPDSNILPLFLAYTLSAKSDAMRMTSNASTIGIMNQEKTKQIFILLPPMQEQREIIDFLNRETEQLDKTIKKSRDAILLLQEHRTSLIAAAVTGKIDVREVV